MKIIIEDLFSGTLEEFRDCFKSYANEIQIAEWCFQEGYDCEIVYGGENEQI